MKPLTSNLGSCLFSTLRAWVSFLRFWLTWSNSTALAGPDSLPHYRSKWEESTEKKIITKLLENISLSAESAVDTIAFSFSARVCARVCVLLSPPCLSNLWCEQSPGLVCPFPACQTIFNNKIHLLLLKAVLSSYPWRSDVCSPFYHLSCTCFDCKHPDNTLVSPSQVK